MIKRYGNKRMHLISHHFNIIIIITLVIMSGSHSLSRYPFNPQQCFSCLTSSFPDSRSPHNTHYCSQCVVKLPLCEDCWCREDPNQIPFQTRRIVVKSLVCGSCRDIPLAWTQHYSDVQTQFYTNGYSMGEIEEAIQYLRSQKHSTLSTCSNPVNVCSSSTIPTNTPN